MSFAISIAKIRRHTTLSSLARAPETAAFAIVASPDYMTHRVEGSGKIDVNVNAPKGTNVKAGSGGMFNQVKVNRHASMPHVDEQH